MAKEELKVVAQEPVELSNESQVKPVTDTTSLDKKESSIAIADPKIDDPEQEENAPPPPPRPLSPRTQAKAELKLAFPAVDDSVITTVLIASLGQLDPAFNALLYYLDPSSGVEIPVPTAIPAATNSNTAAAVSQADEDERLARRLQQEFEREERQRQRLRKDNQRRRDGARRQNSLGQDQQDLDSGDDFEQIKETFTQGFEEAKTTLNGWVTGLAKKFLDGPEEEEQPPRPTRPSNNSPKLFGALGGSLYNKPPNNRFDEDPEILPTDFHNRISLNDHDDDAPALPLRRAAPEQSDSFTEPTSNKKWQPLSTEEANSDAFLVTDSEEEEAAAAPPAVPDKDAKDVKGGKDVEDVDVVDVKVGGDLSKDSKSEALEDVKK